MNICWLVSGDTGGGVVPLALSCARQAARAGHSATLLLVYPSTGWLAGEACGNVTIDSLSLAPPGTGAPSALVRWLDEHPQDVLLFNNCDEAEPAIPYLPDDLCCIYAVHDTARRYWIQAVQQQEDLDGIVAVSQNVADCFSDHWQTPETMRVIYGGSFFPPPAPTGAYRPNALLFCGGENPAKGTGDLIELWRRLERDGEGYELHWFGRVSPEFEARVRALPGAVRIHLHGRRGRDDIFAQAARSRVALIFSRVEAFGMVTIEAMSMGCVPVAWDIATGTREIISEGETGFFAPLGDYDALAAAVKQAMKMHPSLCEAVMRRARNDFSEETMWRHYADYLESVVVRHHGPRSGSGGSVPDYHPPRRYYQFLPASWRTAIRNMVGRHPRLGYLVRNCRGW